VGLCRTTRSPADQAKKNQLGQRLDDAESAAWERLNAMIDWIKTGDIVVVKNTPTWGSYSLAEVVGKYHYDLNTVTNDHRHVLQVKTLQEINKYSAHISGDLRASIDNQRWPISPAVKRATEILNLIELPSVQLLEPVKLKQRLEIQSSNLLKLIQEKVINRLHPKEFEHLVKNLLEAMKFADTTLTAGPSENGADVVMSISAPFFDDLKIVVQIKHHTGEDNDTTSVEQLRIAFDYYKAVAGLLVTSATNIGPQLRDAIEKLKTEGKTVAVLYGDELYRRVLHIFASER
jgi:HJR/Mrr/RecB family endonuclease